MKPNSALVLAAFAICLSGCGSKDSDNISLPPPPPAPSADAVPAVNTAQVPPPAPVAPPPTPSSEGLPPATPAAPEKGDFTTFDENGKPIPGLDFINLAIDGYNRTRSAQTEGVIWPPLASVEQLIQYRIITRLPAAPAGQKFVINPEGKAALAPK